MEGSSPAYFSLRGAAQILGAGVESVRRWATKGVRVNGVVVRLECEVVGVKFKITPAACEQFKANCRKAKMGGGFVPSPDPESEREIARRKKSKAECLAYLKSL